jgi:RNA polymerase sigma factor (sigma-70 family)
MIRNDRVHAWIRTALESYETRLVRYTLRITGDLDEARDVVQEAFVRLWTAGPEQVDGRLPQWLYKVCRNESLSRKRRSRRMTTLNEAEPRASKDPPPSDAAARSDEREALLNAVAALPPEQQEAVRLRFQDGLTYRQIAEITGTSHATVGDLIHQGLRSVRRSMDDSDAVPGTHRTHDMGDTP